jgi:preprotein translocase subunit SecF
VPEGLSPAEVGKEIAEHREHVEHQEHAADEPGGHHRHDRLISVIEAVLLSLVALLAAWSGYSAAKWGSHSSLLLAQASSARSESSLAEIQATQIRTLDSVSFNAVEGAYVTHNAPLFKLTLRRVRTGAKPAFNAWLALHPLKNPHAPADPSEMPQYRIPQERQARVLNAQANADFSVGESASATADKYVRITVLLAAVLFLIGIGSRFPVRVARRGLVAVAAVLLAISVVQLLGLPGPPS